MLGGDLTDFGRTIEVQTAEGGHGRVQAPSGLRQYGDYCDIWLTSKGSFSTETMPNGKTAPCPESGS
ncbi:hypothetical protein [Paenibacillus tyrfis]|uniref:Uncharacterized protein n=1 Tax=Paenibacillus tyrfis TaxID=1501230 RepID=A0A081NWZ9_9BACL|nr:hypothetical protein [Paenibacillus tyrfis]KEQ22972.1 hypothetical protein ET33_20495 [Paenibacillus tyrfis]